MITEHRSKEFGYITDVSTKQGRQDIKNPCHRLVFFSKSTFTLALSERVELASMKCQKELNKKKNVSVTRAKLAKELHQN